MATAYRALAGAITPVGSFWINLPKKLTAVVRKVQLTVERRGRKSRTP
jgi:hypothetical protein